MHQVVETAMRVTDHSSTCIDHFWTNQPHLYLNHGVVDFNLSDHSLISASCKSTRRPWHFEYVQARSFRKFDAKAFVSDLNTQPWHLMQMVDILDMPWCLFKDMFLNICDVHARIKNLRVSAKKQNGLMTSI